MKDKKELEVISEALSYIRKNYISENVWRIEETGIREISVWGLEADLELVPDLYDTTYIVKFPLPLSEKPKLKFSRKKKVINLNE